MPENEASKDQPRTPWNKGKLIGAKPPLRPKHVLSIRTRSQSELLCPMAIGEEAERANSLEPVGENVKQEPTDESVG